MIFYGVKDIYKENQQLKSRMETLVKIYNFKKKVNEYKYDHDDSKYDTWTTKFNKVFSPGPDINDNNFDNIVKPVLDMQTRFSRFKEGIKAIGKSIVSSIGYNQIPLRLQLPRIIICANLRF